jgi:putative intracellular protease/amidase
MRSLSGLRVAVLADFQFSEAVAPLRREGAQLTPLMEASDVLETRWAQGWDALLLAVGDASAERLSAEPQVLHLLQKMQAAGRPMAFLGCAARVAIAAGLVRGRELATDPAMAEDIRRAGGTFQDAPVATDRNWVSGRGDPGGQFEAEMIGLFARSTPAVIAIGESA